MLKVGYIGLGLMGKSIARNILKAGFPVVVHNRSQAAVDELVAEGATAASTPAVVAAQVDVVFTNLPDTPDVEQVVLGEKGIIEGAHDGLILVDNSTIKPASARMIAEKLSAKKMFALDAPVSGGDIGAKNGTLTIMVGGDASALEKVMPVFQSMGKTVTRWRGGSRPGSQGRKPDHGRRADGGNGRITRFLKEGGSRPTEGCRGHQSRRGPVLDSRRQAAAFIRWQSQSRFQGVHAAEGFENYS